MSEFYDPVHNDADPDKLPSYEGKDPRLQEEPWCFTCHNRPASGLLCCSRCRTAWYCNSSCQKSDYKSHKEICMAIDKHLKRVERLAIPLRNTRVSGMLSEPQNIFETQIGIFGQDDEALAYMRARANLIETYEQAATATDVKSVWEMALFHTLELLRLDATGPPDLRDVAPLLLLNVHRDDDAFDFMRYFMKINIMTQEIMIAITFHHRETHEGDWIYPRNKNCRFLDLFEECPDVSDQDVPLGFLVALLIIKCRIVATYDATCRSIALAFGTAGGQRIQEVRSKVKEMLIDETMVNIESQRQQVERLMDVIHRKNPVMLPAMLNPLPLLSQTCPPEDSDSRKVLPLLRYCARCLLRVPGAEAMLEQRFGKNPSNYL